MRPSLLFLLVISVSAVKADEVTDVQVLLPESDTWNQITSDESAAGYTREWVPDGRTGEDTDWIVTVQKLPLERRTSARKFIRTMLQLAGGACTDVKYNGPERIVVDGKKTYWARIMCAEIPGRGYGTFTDQRVVTEGATAYVVTSELRTAPTSVAGVLRFSENADGSVMQPEVFIARVSESGTFTREGVTLCREGDC